MSKVLIELLGADSRSFQQWIDRLEAACLQPSIDIRLAAEIQQQLTQKTKLLQLDHTDTTPRELYYALRHKLHADETRLRETLITMGKKPDDTAHHIATLITKYSEYNLVLSLTPAGVKRILQAYPPKKTLRLLKLRSIESVLKRTDPRILYCLAQQLEDTSWHAQAQARMKRMNSKDIDWHAVETLVLPVAWHEKIAPHVTKKGLWLESPETASICLFPELPLHQQGSVVLLIGRLLQVVDHYCVISHAHAASVYQIGQSDVLQAVAKQELPELQKIHGLQPSWQVVYTLTKSGALPELLGNEFGSTVDEVWQSAKQKLLHLLNDTEFWSGSEYLGYKTDDGVVSFNILDVALDALAARDYESKSWKHMEHALMHELHSRYASQDVIKQSLIEQLTGSDDKMDMLL